MIVEIKQSNIEVKDYLQLPPGPCCGEAVMLRGCMPHQETRKYLSEDAARHRLAELAGTWMRRT